jgi:hypothetical protein
MTRDDMIEECAKAVHPRFWSRVKDGKFDGDDCRHVATLVANIVLAECHAIASERENRTDCTDYDAGQSHMGGRIADRIMALMSEEPS